MICVLGRTGQVAMALRSEWGGSPLGKRHDIRFLGRDEADFLNPSSVRATLESLKPSVVINAAAYTAVDLAEKERESAFLVNATSVGEIARYCGENATPLVHYSTDYVYSGSDEKTHLETDSLAPINTYGESKAQGEREILRSGAHALIFRTSWVYHSDGKNFVRTMLRLGAERESLSVVGDQIGHPTSAQAIARATYKALEVALAAPSETPKWGVYHMAGQGETSWQGFAVEIFRQARELGLPIKVTGVNAIATAEYPTPAKRPLNSRLNQDRLRSAFEITMPRWQDSLSEVLKDLAGKAADFASIDGSDRRSGRA